MIAGFSKMSARERVLSAVVAGTVFVLMNLVLFNLFMRKQMALRGEIDAKSRQWIAAQELLAEHSLWQERETWLKKRQPALQGEGSVGVQLLDEVKSLAKENGVVLANPSIGSVISDGSQKSVSVSIETKSPWNGLIGFLHQLQKPDRFLVLETATLEIDSSDATQMRCVFKIVRWYAP